MFRFCLVLTTIFSINTGLASHTSHTMNQKRVLHRSIKLIDGNVLVTGGVSMLSPFPWPHSSAEIFDVRTQKFIPLPSMNTYHAEHALVQLDDGNVLVINGNQQKTLEIFDVKTRKFHALPPPQIPRAGHTAHVVGNKLFMIGGYQVKLFNNEAKPQELIPVKHCEVYDLTSHTSQLIEYPSLFSRLTMHRSLLLPGGNILIIGGIGNRNNIIEWNTPTLEFSLRGTLKIPREDEAVLFLDETHILISGGTNHEYKTENTLEIFDLNTNESTLLDLKLHEPREAHHMIKLHTGRIILIGGEIHGEPDKILSSVEIVDLNTNKVSFFPELLKGGLSDHEATLLDDGNILVTGGESAQGVIRSQALIIDINLLGY